MPGRASESRLLARVAAANDGERMPPTGERLSAAERAKSLAFARRYGLPNLCRALLNLNEFTFAD